MRTLLALALLAACSSSPKPAPATPAAPPPAPTSNYTPTAFTVKVTGAGRPVIFIPGLASPGSVWDGTVAHLNGKVQAHVLTLAGFAGVPPIKGPFLQTVRDQIVEYIRANHLEHPIVVGHSLGGVMTLWLAADDPDVAAIVDVDGLPFIAAITDPKVTAADAAVQAKQMHDQFASAPHDAFVAMEKGFVASMITNAADVDRIAAAGAASDQETVATAFAELFAKDLRPDLPKIHIPVTIIAATEQGSVPRSTLEAGWHAQVDPIAKVNLQFVEKSRHFVMLDQPDAFYALIDKALAQP